MEGEGQGKTREEGGEGVSHTRATSVVDGSIAPFEHPMDVEEFRKNGHAMVDWMANYFTALKQGRYPVLSQVQPGYLRDALPTSPPEGNIIQRALFTTSTL